MGPAHEETLLKVLILLFTELGERIQGPLLPQQGHL